ncbi:hypothetical protein Q1695_008003 [Nippostrongylus brasiliensis]|nr:hypothetical protein Q1695_008003 [Nippostrongylus brasiliensis]
MESGTTNQSAYGIGLLILLIAALPRILPQLMEPHAVPVVPISVYIFGTMLNFFLLYVYWHWYWHVASLWGSAVRVRFGRVVRNANNRSRRDRPMIPKEEMLLPEALDAEALRSTAIGSKEVGMRRDSSSVSRAFKEAQEQMNGAVPNGGVREKSPQPAGNFLEVPAVSKTVRARYPQEPPVIRAMLKRGKEETGCKTEAAKKRALYKQRSSKVTTDQRRPSQSSARRRSSASTTADDANALVIEPTPSGASTPSPAPPPIIATRLSHNAYENRMLREQEGRRLVSRAPEPRTPRRRLPKTPSGTPCGEIPRPPRFYLPSSEI